MSTPRVDEGVAIAAELTGAGIIATADPGEAENNRPCVLVAPPVLDYAAGTMAGPAKSWRLICLASSATGTLQAWSELDALLAQLEPVVNIETAEPIGYQLNTTTGPVPAYAVRTTT